MPEGSDVWERFLARLPRQRQGGRAGGGARGRSGARSAEGPAEPPPPGPGELNAAERRLWNAYPTGTPVELGTDLPEGPVPGRVVRAEVIARLLLGACEGSPGFVPAVRLRGAYIEGELNVSGGSVDCELRLERCRLADIPNFSNAQTRQVRISESRLPGFDGGGLRADGYLSLSGSVFDGEVRLPRAQLTGGFRMNGTKVTVDDPSKWAIFTGGLVVEVGTFMRNAEITGGIRFTGARMNGGLFMEGAHVRNPGRLAIDGQNMIVQDAMECSRGFVSDGTVRLRGAQVHGTLSFDQAILRAPGERRGALQVSHAQIDELILTPAEPVGGWVSLSYSRIGVILDDQATWPDELQLNGLVFESLRGTAPRERLRWVGRERGRFRPEAYEQLAEWYRRSGHDDLAMQAQLVKQRARRSTLGIGPRAAGYLLDGTVGYGYRPWRAAGWFALLAAVGTAVFSSVPPHTLRPPDQRPHFNAFIYTIDLLVPIPAFGQRDAWDPAGWTQWLAYGLIAAGWILATALVAGATRLLGPR